MNYFEFKTIEGSPFYGRRVWINISKVISIEEGEEKGESCIHCEGGIYYEVAHSIDETAKSIFNVGPRKETK